MLGERFFPLIQTMHSNLAGKITGMLLEIDISELLHMLESPESLRSKVDEAVAILQAHHCQERNCPEGGRCRCCYLLDKDRLIQKPNKPSWNSAQGLKTS